MCHTCAHAVPAQLRSALAKLTARLAGTERVDPAAAHVVVCGDFNSGDVDGAAYALLRDGRLPAGATEHNIEVTKADLSHPFALQDAYQASRCPLPFTRKVRPRGARSCTSRHPLLVHAARRHLLEPHS